MNRIRVLVVDDHPFFRSGVAHWLDQQPDMVCCGQAESVAETRQVVSNLRPDIILLDLRLQDGDGLELVRELAEQPSHYRVIVVSQKDEQVFAHRALRAGARGYITKSEAAVTVREAIETVMKGEIYVSRIVSARLLHNLFPDPKSCSADFARLSDRELQVFQLLGSGLRTREVASQLKISPKTVETYRENLKVKLGLANAEALTQAAQRWVSAESL